MDTKHKNLLHHHRSFLSRNIVWSAALVDQFRAKGLLSEYMIKDIESCATREDKVKKFLEILPLKGNNNFEKLLDILQTSGHVFIADFLREDEDLQKTFDIQDMFKQLPFVKRCFNEVEKKQVETYLSEKIESQVLKILWKRDNREKDKALEAKQQQIEQAYEFEVKNQEQSKAKADTIARLEQEINSAIDDRAELKAKLASLSQLKAEEEKKHKEALAVQMKYNYANDNAISRGNEKYAMAENVLRAIKDKLDDVMKIHKEKHIPPPTAENAHKVKEMIKAQGDFFFLSQDIDVFLHKFNELLEVQKRHENLKQERDYILIHFGWDKMVTDRKSSGIDIDENEEPSLIEAYKHFVVMNDESLQQLKDEIERYDDLLKESKSRIAGLYKENEEQAFKLEQGAQTWQSAIMNVMRKQLQDNKTDMRKKDTRMSMQEEENLKLKKRISELEASSYKKEHMSVSGMRDNVDGNGNMSTSNNNDDVAIETPLPVKVKNLPPLRSSLQNMPKLSINRDASPAQRPSKSRGTPVVVASRQFQPPDMLKGQMTPATSQMNPQTRGGFRGTQMGSVVDNLKAMNKHQMQNRSFHQDERNNTVRKSFNASIKQK